MNKKGFTLIELLAVIIILAVIALISTPVVLNVVDKAKKEANKNSVYGLIDGAKLYYMESLLDINKSKNTNGTTNVIDEIKVSGKKPDNGKIYINSNGETALSVVYDEVCYIKNFESNDLIESDDITNCNIESSISYKCVRATTLHTEECTQTDSTYYCSGAGYTASGSKGTTTITYGNENITLGSLQSGDAFDCDVNGDGTYDPETERFYYVSDLSSNTEYAVLVYSNNTTKGISDNTNSGLIAYDSSNVNYQGPVTAIVNLPTTTQWSNISLSNTDRQIITETGSISTSNSTLPVFSYSKYAARLLTTQEINTACGITVGSYNRGELNECNYLMENTKYSNGSLVTYGYWLETPHASYSDSVWLVSGKGSGVTNNYANKASNYGVRPAIEILKSEILY